MEFLILGPVQAFDGRRVLPVAAAKQRAMLATLLLHANRTVGVEHLIDELWGDRPPARPRVAVQTYAYRLRGWLRRVSARDTALDSSGDGYLLRIPPDALDWDRWRQLVSGAQQALDRGELETGVGRLRQALAMWRGPALADVHTSAVRHRARGMDEHRAEVWERCLAVELALGRHASVLPELETLAGESPYGEGLHAKLMIALYRTGRQADALAVFDRLRHRLADDLGIDPGAELRELHGAILRGELDGAVPGPPAVSAAPSPDVAASRPNPRPVPRQLPRDLCAFSGRQAELDQLDTALTDAQLQPTAVVICAASGTAGIGKTSLVVHWAHGVANTFPDGQLFINLRGFDPSGSPLDPADVAREFLDALGVPPGQIPADPDGVAALYRTTLAGKRVLVVLDNARDAEQVRPLLPGTPGCLAVVTSRNRLASLVAVEAARVLALDLPDSTQAEELFARRIGSDRVADEPEAVKEIVESCARLPLALALAAARAVIRPDVPLAALAAELSDARTRLDLLAGDDARTDLRTVFSLSYQTLSEPAARLFRLLGAHPGPDITAPAMASLAGCGLAGIRAPLAELRRSHLIFEHHPGRYVLHDLLRLYAGEVLHAVDPEPDRRAALRRLIDHYLHTARAGEPLFAAYPSTTDVTPPESGVEPECLAHHAEAMAWFDAEMQVLLSVTRLACSEFPDRAWRLAWAMRSFLYRRGQCHEFAGIARAALDAARRVHDLAGQAAMRRGLAAVHLQFGRYQQAHTHLAQSLVLTRMTSDRAAQADTHRGLSIVLRKLDDHTGSLHHAEQALDLYRATGHRAGQSQTLNGIGWLHAELGDFPQAFDYCRQALVMQQQDGDRREEANTLDSLGYIHHRLGDHDEAVRCYQRALATFREIHDRQNEGFTLASLGDTCSAAGSHDTARHAWQQAYRILAEVNHPLAETLRDRLHAGDARPR